MCTIKDNVCEKPDYYPVNMIGIKIKIFPPLCLEIHLHGCDICVINVTTLELFHALEDCTIQFIKRFCKDCFQN